MKLSAETKPFLVPGRPVIIHGSMPEGCEESAHQYVEFVLKERKGQVTIFPAFNPVPTDSRFDVASSKISSGQISEAAFEILGAANRTLHPTHSWMVTGRSAPMHIPGNLYAMTPSGMGSPLTEVTNFSGVELIIGLPITALTVIEAAEEAARVSYALRQDKIALTVVDSTGKERSDNFVLRNEETPDRNEQKLLSFLEQEEALVVTDWGYLVHTRMAYDKLNAKLREEPLWLLP